jgi:23S rRNA pseudouridine1911/1915/1917 synthase
VARPKIIELPDSTRIPILYEDRSVLVIDKPSGWMVAPEDWVNTRRNLSLAIRSSLENGDWWAQSRNLRFLRFIHRLDAETSGILLAVRSPGAVAAYSRLFEGRDMAKTYLAVVDGPVPGDRWTRRDPIGPDVRETGRFCVDAPDGKEAETRFEVAARGDRFTLIRAHPVTGRTHQIRLHLKASGCPVLGDDLYGRPDNRGLALRAIEIRYPDPFQRRPICIRADAEEFCRRYGFAPPARPALAGKPKPIQPQKGGVSGGAAGGTNPPA